MTPTSKYKASNTTVFSLLFPLLLVFLVLGRVSTKEFPPESDSAPTKVVVVEVPPVDGEAAEKKNEEEKPQPSETGPGLERDTDDPQDIVHTRELLKNMKPGPGVQWRLTMPVPLEETQPDLRRKRRDANTNRRSLARDASEVNLKTLHSENVPKEHSTVGPVGLGKAENLMNNSGEELQSNEEKNMKGFLEGDSGLMNDGMKDKFNLEKEGINSGKVDLGTTSDKYKDLYTKDNLTKVSKSGESDIANSGSADQGDARQEQITKNLIFVNVEKQGVVRRVNDMKIKERGVKLDEPERKTNIIGSKKNSPETKPGSKELYSEEGLLGEAQDKKVIEIVPEPFIVEKSRSLPYEIRPDIGGKALQAETVNNVYPGHVEVEVTGDTGSKAETANNVYPGHVEVEITRDTGFLGETANNVYPGHGDVEITKNTGSLGETANNVYPGHGDVEITKDTGPLGEITNNVYPGHADVEINKDTGSKAETANNVYPGHAEVEITKDTGSQAETTNNVYPGHADVEITKDTGSLGGTANNVYPGHAEVQITRDTGSKTGTVNNVNTGHAEKVITNDTNSKVETADSVNTKHAEEVFTNDTNSMVETAHNVNTKHAEEVITNDTNSKVETAGSVNTGHSEEVITKDTNSLYDLTKKNYEYDISESGSMRVGVPRRTRRRSRRRRKHHRLGRRNTYNNGRVSSIGEYSDTFSKDMNDMERKYKTGKGERVKRRSRRRRKHHRLRRRSLSSNRFAMTSVEETNGNVKEVKDNSEAENGYENSVGVFAERVKRRSRRRRKHHRLGKRSVSSTTKDVSNTRTHKVGVDQYKISPSFRFVNGLIDPTRDSADRDVKVDGDDGISISEAVASVAQQETTEKPYENIVSSRDLKGFYKGSEEHRRYPRRDKREANIGDYNLESFAHESLLHAKEFGKTDSSLGQNNDIPIDEIDTSTEEGSYLKGLISGEKRLRRVARESLEAPGDDVDVPGNSLDENIDVGEDLGDVDSGGAVNEATDVPMEGSDGDVGGIVGAGIAGGVGDELDVDIDGGGSDIAYDPNGEMVEEDSLGGEIVKGDGVDLVSPAAGGDEIDPALGELDDDYDVLPATGYQETTVAKKIEVPNKQMAEDMPDRKKNVKSHGKPSKKHHFAVGKDSTLEDKKQDAWYKDHMRKLHDEKEVLQKHVAETRRKIEGSRDEVPRPRKLSKVMKEKKDKATYKRILSKSSDEKQGTVVNTKIKGRSDDELAKTMRRLEQKVDTLKSMIESGLRKKRPKARAGETKHGHRHKRSLSNKLGLGENQLVALNSVKIISKPARKFPEGENISSFVNMLRSRRHNEDEEQRIFILTLPLNREESSLPSEKLIPNNESEPTDLTHGESPISLPMFSTLRPDDKSDSDIKFYSDRADQDSASYPSRAIHLFQPLIQLPQKELFSKSLFSPQNPGVPDTRTDPSTPNALHVHTLPHHNTVSTNALRDKWQRGAENELFRGSKSMDKTTNNRHVIKKNLAEEDYFQRMNNANSLGNVSIRRMVTAISAETTRQLKNILQNLRATDKNAYSFLNPSDTLSQENSFVTKGLLEKVFGLPRFGNKANKNNLWHWLIREKSNDQSRKRLLREVERAHKMRVKNLLKQILRRKTQELAFKRKNNNVFGLRGPMSGVPWSAYWHSLEKLPRYISATGYGGSERRTQYPAFGSLYHFVGDKNHINGLSFQRAPKTSVVGLIQALELLSNKADAIEKNLGLHGTEYLDGSSKKKFMNLQTDSKIPYKGMFFYPKSLKPKISSLVASSILKLPRDFHFDLVEGRNDALITELEGLVKHLIQTLCSQRKSRLRKLRDLSWSHWMDENEKEKNRQRQGIKKEKEPMTDEEYELERQLRDLLARFPMSEAEYAMNNNLRREDSKIAAASDVLKAVIERTSDEDEEKPVVGSSAAVEMLSHGARRRRHAGKRPGGAPGNPQTPQKYFSLKGKTHSSNKKSIKRSKLTQVKNKRIPNKNELIRKKSHQVKRLNHMSKKRVGKREINEMLGTDQTTSPTATTTASELPTPKPTTSFLSETKPLAYSPIANQTLLNRTKKQAMRKELPYGFGLLFGADPDYFDGDFNEISAADYDEGEENLLRRRLIGTPPHKSGYYMSSDIFPGFYSYHPPGVYKRSVGQQPQEPHRQLQQLQIQQQQQRYDDIDLNDSAVDVDDYEDDEDLEDYEQDDDHPDDDDDDDEDDDERESDNVSGVDEGIQVEDNGERDLPVDDVAFITKERKTNKKVEEPLSWGAWSVCSVTCGLGQRYRVSICGEDGEPCHGRRASEEMEVCEVPRSC
ncbi:novel trypsin family protein [Elysia marginata]|uniref:Novel trypsin family protein n=1 Tax=Elysia marginata TaxID=1093978 RepID=A0AAV4FJM5_9GAST|nr:novel trypsin family protein [Elysia marginata]